MAFIRKVKTTSGATAVQIAYKQKGRIVKIIHIGIAHSEDELRILLDLTHKHLQENQLELFPEPLSSLRIGIKSSFSTLLLNTLKEQYDKLGFPIRSGIVTINGKEILAEPEVPETVKKLLNRLSLGH